MKIKAKWLDKEKALKIAKRKKQFVVEIYNFTKFQTNREEGYEETVYTVLKKYDAGIVVYNSFKTRYISLNGFIGETGCLAKIIWAPNNYNIKELNYRLYWHHEEPVFPEFGI